MKFIHFGCWNEYGCNLINSKTPLSKVMRLLNNYIQNHKIKFIDIAGDNNYPEYLTSKSNSKKLNANKFFSGYDCLPKNIKKYIIFGNHDIEDKMIIDDLNLNLIKTKINLSTNPFNKDNNCNSLDLQYLYTALDPSYKIFSDVIYKIYHKTMIIMIDTTILTNLKNLSSLECYTKIFKNFPINQKLSQENLIKYQLDCVRNIIIKYPDIKNYIFIGHHPIFFCKKSNHSAFITITKDKIINFFIQITDILKDKYIYYLCADSHYYQSSIININNLIINQYIVGTGGAHPEKIDFDYMIKNKQTYQEKNILNNKISYQILNHKNEYGFLVINIKSLDNIDNIKFKFINI